MPGPFWWLAPTAYGFQSSKSLYRPSMPAWVSLSVRLRGTALSCPGVVAAGCPAGAAAGAVVGAADGAVVAAGAAAGLVGSAAGLAGSAAFGAAVGDGAAPPQAAASNPPPSSAVTSKKRRRLATGLPWASVIVEPYLP